MENSERKNFSYDEKLFYAFFEILNDTDLDDTLRENKHKALQFLSHVLDSSEKEFTQDFINAICNELCSCKTEKGLDGIKKKIEEFSK